MTLFTNNTPGGSILANTSISPEMAKIASDLIAYNKHRDLMEIIKHIQQNLTIGSNQAWELLFAIKPEWKQRKENEDAARESNVDVSQCKVVDLSADFARIAAQQEQERIEQRKIEHAAYVEWREAERAKRKCLADSF
ncbi:hypothetical protein [Chromobacterium haemolyticum]|nr:hypothetical protein [Chromobacterium haemolyticum]